MKKKSFIYLTLVASIVIVFICWCNYKVEKGSNSFLSDRTDDLPNSKVGLLLGTSKYLKNGTRNYFFYYRVQAASKLYQSGKIKYILISGDNSKEYYNEPQDMKNELIKSGVPDSVIYLDYAGFRTFDSVVRAKEIFGQEGFIVISQKFHNQRAVFIARKLGIIAFGYNAQDVTAYSGFKTKVREFFSRAKVYFDLAIGRQPKFLGNKIKIG